MNPVIAVLLKLLFVGCVVSSPYLDRHPPVTDSSGATNANPTTGSADAIQPDAKNSSAMELPSHDLIPRSETNERSTKALAH